MGYARANCLLVAGAVVLSTCGLETRAAVEAKAPAAATSTAKARAGSASKAAIDENDWRYVGFQGRWWYWLPENRWVYWQDNRWNDFHAPAAAKTRMTNTASQRTAPASDYSAARPEQAGPGYGRALSPMSSGPSAGSLDQVRPFYGHAQSRTLFGPSYPHDEIGPFYGNALPGQVFGPPSTPNEDIRPFYGHAGSVYGY